MSMRKILVQYIGSVLCLPELEREVEEIAARDKDFRIVQRFIPDRIVHCRDCRFYEYDAEGWDEVLTEQYGEPPCICMYPDGNGDYRRMYAEPHDFCSWGERITDNGGDDEAVK